VQTLEKKSFINRDDAIFHLNFMDDITQDNTKGTWSFQLDSTGTNALVKSFLWPGYYAYHTVHTNMFGGVYIGYGIKNNDLPFML